MTSKSTLLATPALALAAGIALALSIPPFGWWPLAFVGAAMALAVLQGRTMSRRIGLGWLVGLGWAVPSLWWAQSFNWYGAVILMVLEAFFMAVAAGLTPSNHWRLLAAPGAFTLAEAARWHVPFGGLPIGGIDLGQAAGPLLAADRLGGPLLLTGLVWVGGAVLCALVEWARASSRTPRALLGPVLALGAVAAIAAVGVLVPDGGPRVGVLRAAVVQGGGPRGLRASASSANAVFARQVAAESALSSLAAPRLIVWPENVVALGRALRGSADAATLARLARQARATLVAGVTTPAGPDHFNNFAVGYGPSGRIVAEYEKVHRVPFGEYVPWRSFFSHLANLSGVPSDAVPGHGSGLMTTPAAKLGVMISYEVFYADRGRSATRAGGELLVVPTNTASYATSQVPCQEVAADRLQAVAEGRDLIQAAPTGYSDIVTRNGVVVTKSALGSPSTFERAVDLYNGATLYERAGDLPVVLVAGAGLVGGWLLALRRRAHS